VRTSLGWLAFHLLALPGCFDHKETLVRLRDVRDVAVDEPSGTKTILPVGKETQFTPVPWPAFDAVSPGYALGPPVAWLTRDPSGAITMWCTRCVPRSRELTETLQLRGDPSAFLRWTDDELRVRYPYLHYPPGSRSRGVDAFSLTLRTPRPNVLDARRIVKIDRGGTRSELFLGAGVTLLGIGIGLLGGLLASGVVKPSDAEGGAVLLVPGTLFTAMGAFLLGDSIHRQTARDVDEPVVPR
jgi:hypothetical protein